MSAEVTAIKQSYETLGMSPEQIAEDRGLEIEAVKAALLQSSARYRKAVGCLSPAESGSGGTPEDISDEDLAEVTKVIMDIAIGSECDALRLKAAMYIRDDKKGRRDAIKGIQGTQVNILQINQAIRSARTMAERMKPAVIECPTA